jgi:hypothetical protein
VSTRAPDHHPRRLLLALAAACLGACTAGERSLHPQPAPDATGADAEPAGALGDAAPSTDAAPAAGTAPLFQPIDDMEDGARNFVSPVALCSWFAKTAAGAGVPSSGELSVANEELAPPRAGSLHAWHARVPAQSDGLDLRIDFHGPQFPRVPYPDFSAYAGLAFWARSDREDVTLTVAAEDPRVVAASFRAAERAGKPWFAHDVRLGRGWQRYVVLFEDLQQPSGGAGPRLRLDPAAVWSFHFLPGLAGGAADTWIDDLALLCRGSCPRPPFEVPSRVTALDDGSLTWTRGESVEPALRCAELASLASAALDGLPAGEDLPVLLRVRVPPPAPPEVPVWAWTVQHVATRTAVAVTALDQQGDLVALRLAQPGQYRIAAHTHLPGTAACGVEVLATAVAP